MQLAKLVVRLAAASLVWMLPLGLAKAAGPPDPYDPTSNPGMYSERLYTNEKFTELDQFVMKTFAEKRRSDDGRYMLYHLTYDFEHYLGLWDESHDAQFAERFEQWHQQVPDSKVEPVFEAMFQHALAWRARGGGYSSEVATEAWQLFEERNQKAWNKLMDNRKVAATFPTWYEVAIAVGTDLGLPDEQIKPLYDEGVKKFPGYHPIYFAYGRHFAPRWGGDYESADAFVLDAVEKKKNPEGDVLYTRLYWFIDQYSGSPESFFEDSLVSWPRMRGGFEQLMKTFPDSKWNLANFAMFACRAHDGNTYMRLRPTVDPGQARAASEGAYSIEVCDARFMKKT